MVTAELWRKNFSSSPHCAVRCSGVVAPTVMSQGAGPFAVSTTRPVKALAELTEAQNCESAKVLHVLAPAALAPLPDMWLSLTDLVNHQGKRAAFSEFRFYF